MTKFSQGYDAEFDMGDAKEVVKINAIETHPGSWHIAVNGKVLGDSRGYSREVAEEKISDMCDMVYCCVTYVKRPSVKR